MKRIIYKILLSVVFLTLCVFGLTSKVHAAAFNDAASGDWNIGTTWGGLCAAACTAGVDYPGASDTTTIDSHTVTMTASHVSDDFTLSGGTLTMGANTLTIDTGSFTVSSGTFNEDTGTLAFIGTQNKTFDVNVSLTVNNFTINAPGRNLTIDAGDTIIVSGTTTLTDGAVKTGILNALGDVSIAATFDGGDSPVTFSGGNTQNYADAGGVLPTGTWTINKTVGTAVVLGDNLTFVDAAQDLVITSGSLDLNGNNLTVVDDFTVNASGTLQLEGGEATTVSGVQTLDASSTVLYDGAAGPYTVKNYVYQNLTINGGGTFNLGAGETVSGNFIVSAGTFDAADNIFSIDGTTTINGGTLKTGTGVVTFGDAGGDTVTISSGTLEIESDDTTNDIVVNAGTWTNSGGTVVYTGNAVTTKLLTAIDPYNDLTINDSASGSTYTLDGNLDVDGNFTLTGGTLDADNTNNYQINAAKSWSNSDTFTARAGTVIFDTTTTNTITGSTTFYNLTSTAGGKTLTFTDGTTQTISNTLTLTGSANNLITLGGTGVGGWTITDSGTESVSYVDVSYGTATNGITAATSKDGGNNSNWTFSASSVTWDGSTDTDWDTAANWDGGYVPNTTDNVTIANVANDPVLATAVTTNNLTINASGILYLNGKNLTVSGTYANDGTLQLNGDETTVSLTNDSDSGSTKFVKSSGTITIKDLSPYYNVEFDSDPSGDGTATFTLPAAIDVNNNFTMTDGGVDVSGSNYQITVGNSWQNTNNETLTARAGTVVFDDSSNTNTITGSTTFYNLTSTTASKTITFTDGTTQTVSNILTLTGTANNLITLGGTGVGGWTITDSGTESVSYVDVSYGTATNGITAATSKDGSNNSNWTFSASSVTWDGSTDTDWDTAANWDGGYVPNTTDNVTIANVANDPVLATAVTTNNLTINASGILYLNGQNLTVSGTYANDGTLQLNGDETTVSLTNDSDSGSTKFVKSSGTITIKNLSPYYNVEFDSDPSGDGTATFTLPAAIDVNNNFTMTDGGVDVSGSNYQITVGNSWQNANNETFTARSGTVVFDDSSNTNTITGSTTFYNLTSTTASKTITFTDGTTQTISNTLTLTGAANNLITLGGTGVGGWTITDSGTESVSYVDVSYGTATNGITAATSNDGGNNSNWTFSVSSVTWDGSTDTDWDTAANWDGGYVPNTTDNVTIANVANDPVLATAVTTNNLTINASGILYLNGQNLTVSGTYANDGTLQLNGDETTVSLTNDSDSGSTKFVKSSGTITIKNLSPYYNVEFDSDPSGDGTATFTLPAAIDVNNTFTMTDGGVDVSGSNYQITVGNSWQNTNNETFTARAGTVILDTTTTNTITGSTAFYNLTSTTASKTITFTDGTTQTVSNILTLTGAANNLITLVGTGVGGWTITDSGTESVSYVDVSYGTATNGITAATSKDSGNNSNWTFSVSSVTWDGSTDTDWDTAANWDGGYVPNTTDNVTIADVANDPILATAVTTNNLTINVSGILYLNGQNLTVSGTYANNGTLQLDGDETTVSLTNDSDSGNTKFVKSSGTITVKDLSPYYNIEFDSDPNGDGTATFTLPAAIDVNNNFTMTDGGVDVSGSNYQITVGNSWQNTNNETFTARAGTVIFDTTTTNTITGSTTFYNLTSTAGGKTLTFTDGTTQTISNTLTLTGSANNLITLGGTGVGGWTITDSGTESVSYVDVSYGTATNGITAATSNDGGNNSNWTFSVSSVTWDGSTDTDWDTGANWDGGYVPNTTDNVTIANVANDPVLATAVTTNNLTISASGILYLNGQNLTVSGTYANDGTLQLNGDETTVSLTNDSDSGSTKFVKSSGTITIKDLSPYYNVEFDSDPSGDGTATFTLPAAIDVNNNFTMTDGGVDVSGSNYQITVGNSWQNTNNETLTARAGTVVFDDSSNTNTITGSTTFYNLSSTTSNKAITFTAGTTQAVNNTLTLTGTAGNLITLRSSSGGSKWDFTFPNGVQAVSFLDVEDGDVNTNTVTCTGCADTGNNGIDWFFGDANYTVNTPGDSKTVGQTPTIVGVSAANSTVILKDKDGTQVGSITTDSSGNFTAELTGSLAAGANIITPFVNGRQGLGVSVTVAASPTTDQVPTITSHSAGVKLISSLPIIVGKGLASQSIEIKSKDTDGVLTTVGSGTVDGSGNYSVTLTTALKKGNNDLFVTVDDVASDMMSVTLTDPFGVIFDSVTNTPINGATVTLFNSDGTLTTPGVEIAATDVNPVETGADGFYSFFTINANFYITVTADNFNYPSNGSSFPSRTIVTGSKGEQFTVSGVVIEMDHPMDPNLIVVTKIANKKDVVVGDIVTYTVTMVNSSSATVTNLGLEDRIPAGFKYVDNRATLDGVAITPTGTRTLIFAVNNIAVGETKTLIYQLVVGSGVTYGKYENTALIKDNNGAVLSNRSVVTVDVVPDALFNLGTVIGKVNTVGGDASVGSSIDLSNIRIVTADGVIIRTDKHGRFNVPGLIEGRHVFRLDERTLPVGAEISGKKAVVVDVRPGGFYKVQFGVSLYTEDLQGVSGVDTHGNDGRKPSDIFFVALGDLESGYTFTNGNLEALEAGDQFNKGFWSEGKFAYYLEGKILGKYLITSSYDSDRDKKELFRNLDPDKYYPVYGDNSTIDYKAANTQGNLYLMIEWDKSEALWGNYTIDFDETELTQFSRSMYGGKVDYQSLATSKDGMSKTKVLVFGATAKQRAAHNEFLSTGGSLYYLKHQDVIEGSEQIEVELRDKITGLVLKKILLNEESDYQIDYEQGRILFLKSVQRMVDSGSIIGNSLLDGNPVYVVADYEYEVIDKVNEASVGLRVSQAVGDKIRVGGTYVQDNQIDQAYELKGVDVTFNVGARREVPVQDDVSTQDDASTQDGFTSIQDDFTSTQDELASIQDGSITFEYAESQSQSSGSFISTDGGLSFTDLTTSDNTHGKAYGIRTDMRLFNKIDTHGYYKWIDQGFSSRGTDSQQGKELMGIALEYELDEKTQITVRTDIQKLIDNGNLQTQLQVGASKTTTTLVQVQTEIPVGATGGRPISSISQKSIKLIGEYKHQSVEQVKSQFESETNTDEDTIAVRAEYPLNKKVDVAVEQQITLHGDISHQTSVEIEAQVNDHVKVNVKESVGSEGWGTSVGASVKAKEKVTLTSDYSLLNKHEGGFGQSMNVGAELEIDKNRQIQTSIGMEDHGGELSSILRIGAKEIINERLALTSQRMFTNNKTENIIDQIYGITMGQDQKNIEANLTQQAKQDADETSQSNIYNLIGRLGEKLEVSGGYERGKVQKHDGSDLNRQSFNMGLNYVDQDKKTKLVKLKSTSKIEYRVDEGDTDENQYLLYHQIESHPNENTTLFFKGEISKATDEDSSAKKAGYKEIALGGAYRPISLDRFNMLGRYTYLEDDGPASQIDTASVEKESAHVISFEGIYDLNDKWQIMEKFAYRIKKEDVSGLDATTTNTWLMITGLGYQVANDWIIKGEYRLLRQEEAKDYKQGLRLGAAHDVGDFAQVEAGYDFTDFTDDLANLDYTAHGPYLRVTAQAYDLNPDEIKELKAKLLAHQSKRKLHREVLNRLKKLWEKTKLTDQDAKEFYEKELYVLAKEKYEEIISVKNDLQIAQKYLKIIEGEIKEDVKLFRKDYKEYRKRIKKLQTKEMKRKRRDQAKENKTQLHFMYKQAVELYQKKKYQKAKVKLERVNKVQMGYLKTSKYLKLIKEVKEDKEDKEVKEDKEDKLPVKFVPMAYKKN